MPCDTRPTKPNQTLQQRVTEVRRIVELIASGLASGRIKPKVGPQGAIAFLGLTEADRDGVTDACAYRRIMATGNAQAKLAIQRAEFLAGRTVDRQAIAAGWHSHDQGVTWNTHRH